MRVINESDLSIVSLMPGVIDCAYPSKTMSYLESGCRILGMLEPDSELAQLINEKAIGTIAGDMSAENIADAVKNEFQKRHSQNASKENIRAIGRELFGRETILNQWTHLLSQLENQGRTQQ